MRSRVVFGSPFVVVWEAGILEVIGSRGESTRNEVGCLDPPTGQLASELTARESIAALAAK